IDPDRAIAVVEQTVRLSASLNDPLLHARTELLAGATRLLFDSWRMADWDICASASATIQRLSDAGAPAYHRMVYAHLRMARGDYADALKDLEAGIPQGNDSPSTMVHFVALSGKTLALLYSGRLGELAHLLRAGRASAEKSGNEPWFFLIREAWLRTA